MASFKPRGVVGGGGGGRLGIAIIQLPQPSLAWTWAELGNTVDKVTRKVLIQETINKIKGLATECREICLALGLPDLMATEVTKTRSSKQL